MNEGNHNATTGQRDYDKRGACPNCGAIDFTQIDWCENDMVECSEDCPSYCPTLDCPMCVQKMKCNNCEHVGDME
jgi:hypothetical protein